MSDKTSIEWTATVNADGSVTPGATWNPVVGCDRISPGCAHCYAKAIHDRRHKSFLAGGNVLVPQYAKPFEVVRPRADRLEVPLHWKKPRRVFVNSMSDLFHEDVPDDFLHQVYHTMEAAHWHTFQVLTKRAERMRAYLSWRYGPDADAPRGRIPSRHIWHGVSVENRAFKSRILDLKRTPSAVRFLSLEPLLEDPELNAAWIFGIDWLIVGGESGPRARPFDLAWARKLVALGRGTKTPVFVKQLGTFPRTDAVRGHEGQAFKMVLNDRKGGTPDEWPIDLRVREFPEAR